MYGLSSIKSSKYSVMVLSAGVVLMIVFIRTELKVENPVMDIRLLRNNTSYAFSNFAALLNYGATFAISYLISIYLQIITGYDSQTAGIVLISSPVIMALLSPLMGRLSDNHSPYIMSSTGLGFCAVSLILFAFLPEDASVVRVILILVLSGFGVALFTSPNTNAVMTSVEKDSYGIASSILATMRSIGHTASMAIVTAVVEIKMDTKSLTDAEPFIIIDTIHLCFYIFTGLCTAGIFIALKRKP